MWWHQNSPQIPNFKLQIYVQWTRPDYAERDLGDKIIPGLEVKKSKTLSKIS